MKSWGAWVAVSAVAGLVSGCSSAELSSLAGLPEADQRALIDLAQIAPLGAEIGGAEAGVACWQPSEHPIPGTPEDSFRVLCRVHFAEEDTARYRDVICIGHLGSEPVSESCYRWAFYTGIEHFDDATSYLIHPSKENIT